MFPPRWIGNSLPDLCKQAVDPVRGRWRLDGEIFAFPEILRVRGSCSTIEAPQHQVIVRVVPCIPNRQVIGQMTVYAQDLVGPGAHLLSYVEHAPRLAVLQPRLVSWEEVTSHVFQPLCGQGCLNLLFQRSSLLICQLGVKVSGNQQCAPPGPLADGCNDVLYCRDVVWGQVAPHGVLLMAA